MPLTWPLRWVALLCGLGLLGLLITARWLEPAAQGYGTHQQLGLPACSSLVLFDAICPACGMTTSWAWVMRGELVRGLQVNAGGSLLALIALAYLPVSCYFFCGGRTSQRGNFSFALGMCLLLAMAVAIAQWVVRLGVVRLAN